MNLLQLFNIPLETTCIALGIGAQLSAFVLIAGSLYPQEFLSYRLSVTYHMIQFQLQ